MLVALLVAEMVHAALGIGGESPAKPASPVAASPQRSGVDMQTIVAAHLFGVPLSTAQDPGNARPAAANLVLEGTIATEDPQRGMALIHDEGPPRIYSVGDQIGGASLHLVYLDHVILERAGRLESLSLPRTQLAGRSSGASYQSADRARYAPVYTDSLGRTVDKPPGNFDKIVRTVGSIDNSTGKQRGVMVYPLTNGAPLRAMGLSPGDLIVAINGSPLDDPKLSKEALETIQSAAQVNVTVERQGHKMDLTLNIAEGTRAAAD